MQATVSVFEEVLNGNRLMYVERRDMMFQVRGAVPSELKGNAVSSLREKGLVVVAANVSDLKGRAVKAIIRSAAPTRAASKAPVYRGETLPPRRR